MSLFQKLFLMIKISQDETILFNQIIDNLIKGTAMKTKLICFATLFLTQNVFAAESLNTKVHNQYQSLRAMGMGNAFTTVADDYTALLYNPAVLAKKKRGEIQFTLAGVGISSQTTTIMKDISDAEKNATGDAAKATAISNALDQYYGKPLGGRVQALEIFWVRPNWGLALIPVDLSLDMTVNRQLGPALDLNIKKDTTLAYGYGKNVSPTLSAGLLGKIIHRDSVEQAVAALELATNSNVLSRERFKEGITADLEFGLLWAPEFTKKIITKKSTVPADDLKIEIKPEETKPEEPKRDPQSEDLAKTDSTPASADTTVAEKIEPAKETAALVVAASDDVKTETVNPLLVSFVARNLISADFSKSTLINKDATTAPSKIPRVIDIGVGYDLTTLGDLKLRLTAEAKNLLHPNTTVRKSSHAGFEVDYSPGSWFKTQFRAGINQMYFTAGLTLLLGVVEIDAVTYGEEVGTSSTNVENRVNAVKVGFNF
jgi:hypothetical protein